MADTDRSPEELYTEIGTLRARVAQLEQAEAERKRTEEAMGQERVQTYLDIVGVMLLALNERGEITLINRKGCAVLGYEEGELIGKNWAATCLPARLRKDVQGVFEKLMAGEIEATEYYENPILTKAGEERIIAWYNTLLTNEAGQITGTLSSGEDITERRRAEAALKESHERFLTVLDSIDAHIYVADMATYEILFMNRQMRDDFGDDLLGKTCWHEFRGDSGPCDHCTNDRLVDADGNPTGLIVWEMHNPITGQAYVNHDRAITWVDSRLVRLQVAIDITDRKQAEEELNRRVRQSRSLQRVAHSLTANLELEDILSEVIDAVAEVFEAYDSILVALLDGDENLQAYALDESSQGHLVRDHGFPSQPLDKTASGQVIQTGQPLIRRDLPREAAFPFDQVSIDLGRRSQMFVPLVSGGRIIGTLYVGSNQPGQFSQAEVELLEQVAASLAVAVRNAQLYQELEDHNESLEQTVKERTTELEETNEDLLALSRLKDQFVSNVSHELRTPISSLKLYIELLQRAPAKKHDAYLAALGRETNRLNRIIEDLLHLSRLDRETMQVNPTTENLNMLARQYVVDRAPLAESRGLTLSLKTHDGLPVVRADAGLLGQALSVLLTNALNYTPQGGQVVISTHIRQDEGKQWAGISVGDTGPGIPPDEQEQLFDRFFRGEVGRDSGAPGTGLGLAIAAEIVDLHQGRIEVQSDGISGQGTTFSLWLPVAE